MQVYKIKRNDSEFEALRFVLRAVSKDPLHEHTLCNIKIFDKHVVASNGRILFYAPMDCIPDGLYTPINGLNEITLTKDIHPQARYPKTKNIKGIISQADSNTLLIGEFGGRDRSGVKSKSGMLYELARAGVCLNFNYVDLLPDDREWEVRIATTDLRREPVKFTSGDYLAVIMPMYTGGEHLSVSALARKMLEELSKKE
jgi:hypothetical protein